MRSGDSPSPAAPGPRQQAQELLAALDPLAYASSRNHLAGAVSRLSPYVRHGVITLAELRRAVLGRLPPGPEGLRQASGLIRQLAWRDYWQRIWMRLGDGIWSDLEALKTGHAPDSYEPELPADVDAAATGLACIDAFAAELMTRGWLHNHARLWLASYVVHWRRIRWQTGARWFLKHLLDGDPASNNLSWQWVTSSFSSKPYWFNRENLERFGAGHHCNRCAAASRCPFEASYEALQEQLFQPVPPASGASSGPAALAPQEATAPPDTQRAAAAPIAPGTRTVVWIHEEALGPGNPALQARPNAPAIALLDAAAAGPRLELQRRCLQELAAERSLEVVELPGAERDPAPALLRACARQGPAVIVTSRAVDPRLQRLAAALSDQRPVVQLEPEPFVDNAPAAENDTGDLAGQGATGPDLRRFSRYWRWAEPRLQQQGSQPRLSQPSADPLPTGSRHS